MATLSVPRIYATCDIGSLALDRLRERGWAVEVHGEIEPPPPAVVLEKVQGGVDALITTLRDRVDEAVFAAGAGAGLRVVSQMAVGVDNIDLAAARRHGIPVTHTPDVLTAATAEFAFFLLGVVARRTWSGEVLLREGRWKTWHPWHPWLGDEVTGRTLAVIGLGRIGRSVVEKAVGFDMDVLCHSRREDPAFLASVRRVARVRREEGFTAREQQVAFVSLAEALSRADFVSLHLPLTRPGESDRPTFHLMDAVRLGLLKPTAYLVNTSRGAVIDEGALCEALLAGRLAGAALDVFEREPLPADSPLRDPRLADRLRLLPHLGSAARATRLSPDPDVGMAGRAVQGVIDALTGAPLRFAVRG